MAPVSLHERLAVGQEYCDLATQSARATYAFRRWLGSNGSYNRYASRTSDEELDYLNICFEEEYGVESRPLGAPIDEGSVACAGLRLRSNYRVWKPLGADHAPDWTGSRTVLDVVETSIIFSGIVGRAFKHPTEEDGYLTLIDCFIVGVDRKEVGREGVRAGVVYLPLTGIEVLDRQAHSASWSMEFIDEVNEL